MKQRTKDIIQVFIALVLISLAISFLDKTDLSEYSKHWHFVVFVVLPMISGCVGVWLLLDLLHFHIRCYAKKNARELLSKCDDKKTKNNESK